MSLHTLAVPAAIPADAVELLRALVMTPATPERTLEEWIREFPQIIGTSAEFLRPHTRFRLPGEPGKLWEPDVLYRETGSSYYDLIELKRADRRIVAGGSETIWVPSSPPRFTSYAASAISQMQLYIADANEHREFFEKAHNLQLFVPRGLIIAGQETDVTTSRNLRLLRWGLPSGIQFITWTAILRRAEQLRAHKVMISVPCIVDAEQPADAFNIGGFHQTVTASFHPWTGFLSPYAEPLRVWEALLHEAWEEIRKDDSDTDGTDESWTEYCRFRGSVLEPIYYRLGKYCLSTDELDKLLQVLPNLYGRVNRRSFQTFIQRVNIGFEDTQNFLRIGAEAKSVPELKALIEKVVFERQSRKISNGCQEPEVYYRRVMTHGFLKAKLNTDLDEVMRVGSWIARKDNIRDVGCG